MRGQREVKLEAAFQKQVIDLLRLRSWRVAHFRTAQTARGAYVTPVAADGKGFPDLVAVRRGRLIFVELKSKTGRLGAEQRVWLDELNGAAEVYVWRPSDWAEIERTLV